MIKTLSEEFSPEMDGVIRFQRKAEVLALVMLAFRSKRKASIQSGSGSDQVFNDRTAVAAVFRQIRSIAWSRPQNTSGADRKESRKS